VSNSLRFPNLLKSIAVVTVLLLSGCASGPRSKADELTATIRSYEGAIRWGNLTDAAAFLDPESATIHPVTKFNLDRFAQLTVVGYRTQTATIVDETGTARQQVTIELVNKHTQTPRTILDSQTWRFEPKSKRWLLTSGLPDLENTVEEQ
jgi:hypothetical protein